MPAEEQTGGYSNRFAGHVIRQRQARALMKRRGWRPTALAYWDDGLEHAIARRRYPDYDVRAELFYDPIEDVGLDDSGMYPYCTTDQVRFFLGETDTPLALADVPPVLFSEAMRDVDLFISVASIGADPDWHDRREGRRFHRYWHEFNHGALDAAAQTRQDILRELVSRLPVAARCQIDDRHLRVNGTTRTYRIHLGSGRVLVSPDERELHLRALTTRRAAELYLPVDDDPTLIRIVALALQLGTDDSLVDGRGG